MMKEVTGVAPRDGTLKLEAIERSRMPTPAAQLLLTSQAVAPFLSKAPGVFLCDPTQPNPLSP